MIDPKALDAAFGRVLADVAALLQDGDVIAVDGKALRGARDVGESARTRMMVSAYAARLRLTLASVPADRGTELEAAIEALGLIALKGKVVTADALPLQSPYGCSDQRGWRRLVPRAQGQPGLAPVRCPGLLRDAARRAPQRGKRG